MRVGGFASLIESVGERSCREKESFSLDNEKCNKIFEGGDRGSQFINDFVYGV